MQNSKTCAHCGGAHYNCTVLKLSSLKANFRPLGRIHLGYSNNLTKRENSIMRNTSPLFVLTVLRSRHRRGLAYCDSLDQTGVTGDGCGIAFATSMAQIDRENRLAERGGADRIRDPQIKPSIAIIIRTAYAGQVRETNGVDPRAFPGRWANWTGFFIAGSVVLRFLLNRPFKRLELLALTRRLTWSIKRGF
ncbi:hypothetical protein ACJJTC_014759 [Scirpophaga incertulas]